MSKELEGDMVFDASAIVELIYSSPAAVNVKEAMERGTLNACTSEISLTEAEYVICRRLGKDEASSRIRDLIDSNLITIQPLSRSVSDLAAKYKCHRSISLADCFALALAKSKDIPILFAKKEAEIVKEMKKSSFDVEIRFLEKLEG